MYSKWGIGNLVNSLQIIQYQIRSTLTTSKAFVQKVWTCADISFPLHKWFCFLSAEPDIALARLLEKLIHVVTNNSTYLHNTSLAGTQGMLEAIHLPVPRDQTASTHRGVLCRARSGPAGLDDYRGQDFWHIPGNPHTWQSGSFCPPRTSPNTVNKQHV
jgi:hypothetical protein